MTSLASQRKRLEMLEHNYITAGHVEIYAPTLPTPRDRDIAMSYFIRMEPSKVLAERYSVGSARIHQLAHRVIRLTMGRMANKVDPIAWAGRINNEREFNYRLKTGIGFNRVIKIPKLRLKVKLTKEIMDFLYPIFKGVMHQAQKLIVDAMFTIIEKAESLEEARAMLINLDERMTKDIDEAFGRGNGDDDDQDT